MKIVKFLSKCCNTEKLVSFEIVNRLTFDYRIPTVSEKASINISALDRVVEFTSLP